MKPWAKYKLRLYAMAATAAALLLLFQLTLERRRAYPHYITILSEHHAERLTLWQTREIIFLGDSHIQFLDTAKIRVDALNLGIGGLTTQVLLEHLPTYEIAPSQLLVIGTGINDLAHFGRGQTQTNLRALTAYMNSRGSTWSLLEIMPVNEVLTKIKNDDIRALNALLADLCIAPCTLIRSHGAVATIDGNLHPDYDRGDGLHLNQAGYQALIDQIKSQFAEQPMR